MIYFKVTVIFYLLFFGPDLSDQFASLDSEATYQCQSDQDCVLNGKCNLKSHTCDCYHGWTSDDCGRLNLRPSRRFTGYNRTSEGISSWGGRIIKDHKNNNTHHLFVSEFANGCGLGYWSPMSTIVRAISNVGIEGPYEFVEVVVETFAHNPTIVFSKFYNAYLLFHIGCPFNSTKGVCSESSLTCGIGNTNNGESGITAMMSSSIDPPGGWKNLGIVFNGLNSSETWDSDRTNPSVHPLDDGTIILAYRGCPYDCYGEELINIAIADSLTGTYKPIQADPIFNETNEDPFIWKDPRGNWHMLLHSLEKDGGFGSGPKVGRHAFASSLEGPWTWWNRTLAFNTTVHFEDDTEINFYRRERPQLHFDDVGNPTHLITGVQEVNSSQSYTLIQPIDT